MKATVSIVLGTLFGDEGKGSFVNYLSGYVKQPMVVRFNGGHQVGHTVVLNGKRHVFSNFGSGTLLGVATYWSKYCTVSPTGIKKEGDILRKSGVNPKLYLDSNAMVTTPFDILQNHRNEDKNKHGSVGVGFGTTIQRNEDHYHLYVRDLLYSKIRNEKLRLIIESYYGFPFDPAQPHQCKETRKLYNDFLKACDELVERYEIRDNFEGLYDHHLIFEGGQGIMLDANYGFFPNVTRSNTTSQNAIEIIKTLPFDYDINTYYIIRAYQCRHGNGYMSNEGLDISYIENNPNETNITGKYQGEFRKSVLDLDMIGYAIGCDMYHNPKSRRHLVITCLDQVPEDIPVTINDELTTMTYKEIGKQFDMRETLGSFAETGYKFDFKNF